MFFCWNLVYNKYIFKFLSKELIIFENLQKVISQYFLCWNLVCTTYIEPFLTKYLKFFEILQKMWFYNIFLLKFDLYHLDWAIFIKISKVFWNFAISYITIFLCWNLDCTIYIEPFLTKYLKFFEILQKMWF